MSWNLEPVYDEKIRPLMDQIVDICKEQKLPFFATFYLTPENEEAGALYCTTNYLPDERAPIPTAIGSLLDVVMPPRPRGGLKITTKDKDGNITNIDYVVHL